MGDRPLRVLVLAGGPDRERAVSQKSGREVAAALRDAGHAVREADITPDDLSALDAFSELGEHAIFPALHGAWGEGGGLQAVLDARGLPYVGCRPAAARQCMDKAATKARLAEVGIATPPYEVIDTAAGNPPTLDPPVVVKPDADGSSIDVAICPDAASLAAAWGPIAARNPRLLVERFIDGPELTVGILGDTALPPIQIVPATAFYDYNAKYERDDTRYRFAIELPTETLRAIERMALATHRALGCRHLCRVDLMVDREHRAWVIEVNTMPGFTTHSLLPMAAAHAGIPMPDLCDRLIRMAIADHETADER